MTEKPKHDSEPLPVDFTSTDPEVPQKDATPSAKSNVKTPQEFRHLLRDGYRYLLQTSALAQKVDVPKSVAFFLEHIARLKPEGLLDLNAIYENLLAQGAPRQEIKEALVFFKTREHRFNTHMQLPVALEDTNKETLAAILSNTSGSIDGNIRQSKATEAELKALRPRLTPSKAPKAYTQDVVPGSKEYLRDLGVNPDLKFDLSEEGEPIIEEDFQEVVKSTQSNNHKKTEQKKTKKRKKAPAQAQNFNQGLLLPMGIAYIIATVPVILVGNIRYTEGMSDPITVARYFILLAGTLVGYSVVFKKKPTDFLSHAGLHPSPLWSLVAIVLGTAIGYSSGVFQVKQMDTYLVQGAINALFTIVFFAGFLGATISKVDDSPMVPGFITAVVFGYYALSYPWVRNLEGMTLWYWVANMTVFVGFPIGYLRGRSESIIPPLFFYICVSLAPGLLPLLGIKS